ARPGHSLPPPVPRILSRRLGRAGATGRPPPPPRPEPVGAGRTRLPLRPHPPARPGPPQRPPRGPGPVPEDGPVLRRGHARELPPQGVPHRSGPLAATRRRTDGAEPARRGAALLRDRHHSRPERDDRLPAARTVAVAEHGQPRRGQGGARPAG